MNEVIGAMGNGGAVRGGRVIIYFALLPTPVPYILYSTPIYVLLVGEVEDGVIGRAIGAITHPPPSTPLLLQLFCLLKKSRFIFCTQCVFGYVLMNLNGVQYDTTSSRY